jgi:CO/xanthine dehydrogenase FAD-binding subunit
MGLYERPSDLGRAVALAGRHAYAIIAGGTDFYPARVGRAIEEDILDLTAVGELRRITEDATCWRLGALVTWSDLLAAPLPALFDGYKAAAREIGGRQIQNAGTLAGNLCNASPAADGTPNLLALDAAVEIRSLQGTRSLPVGTFVTGNRRTALAPGEIVTALIIPKPRREARAAFRKLGARRYLVISIVMAAAVIEIEDGHCRGACLALGACSAVPLRLAALENALAGVPLGRIGEVPTADHLRDLSPIDDVRGSAAFRKEAALALVRDVLREAAGPC